MHIKTMGQGPDLVMLHGWSMHSAVWHELAEGLSKNFTLHLVDLPGHGQSHWQEGDLQLDTLIAKLAAQLPEQAHYLGWSLGGLISIAFAKQYPQRVNKLILMAATPRFVQDKNWSCAVQQQVFEQFAENLDENQSETLQRFLLLQARGSKHSKQTIKQLAQQLAQATPPVASALQDGLSLLINTDMRQQLQDLTCPVQCILGDRDTLIPTAMIDTVKQFKPDVDDVLLAGAGHAPFISQPVECQQAIERFIND
ncbi:pimeloyl-[acyl-carrier protein] methyl ester esterase [Methylophaga sp. 42_25_T18]|nr:pimeloyl-[acyl-carrier protein] methyl ester esterase [Methylophaga sp. 42_25_T18]OUR89212.1 pimeloyl-[acyl-carrier protein] methyl ester esterase [Methylophaga sp. 42_8_T64]